MIKPEHIPDEVIEEAVAMRDRGGSMSDIIRAAINAWGGAHFGVFSNDEEEFDGLLLPIADPTHD